MANQTCVTHQPVISNINGNPPLLNAVIKNIILTFSQFTLYMICKIF